MNNQRAGNNYILTAFSFATDSCVGIICCDKLICWVDLCIIRADWGDDSDWLFNC